MPNIGRETIAVNPRAVNSGSIKGLRITMAEAGSAGVTITAYVSDSATGDGFRCALIQDGDKTTVLASSDIRTDISTAGWYTFSGGGLASFTPANATSYVLAVSSNSAANANAYEDDASLDAWAGATSAFDPLALSGAMTSDAIRDYSIYMTYTAAGGSDNPLANIKRYGPGRYIPFIR